MGVLKFVPNVTLVQSLWPVREVMLLNSSKGLYTKALMGPIERV
jgi:hypothetical protein